MRSIVCRYETADLLAEAAASPDRELAVHTRPRQVAGSAGGGTARSSAPPESSRGAADGEWVLAIVELASTGKATAAAARVRRYADATALVFEPRDWTRVCALVVDGPAEGGTSQTPDEPPRTERSPKSRAPRGIVRKLADPAGARILLVDDDAAVREVVGAMLEAVGFEVVGSHNGEDALAHLGRDAFHLVVLDWTLPGMSGLDLCRAVRARFARLPVLFLTANAAPSDVVEAFAGGADDYVVKPFRAPELGARIFGLLRRASAAT